jgi:hypothetical protein
MRSPRSLLDIVAWLVSAILSPFLVFIVLIAIFVIRANADTQHFLYWSIVTLMLMASVPTFYIFWQVRQGKITDPHIKQREQRLSVFIVFVISLLLGALVLWKIGAPHSFLTLTLLIFVNSFVAGIITMYWKISIHSWVLAGAITIYGLVFVVPTWFWWTFLSVPLVIWSRVYRGRHTLGQGLAGALAGIALTVLLYQLFVRP